MAITQTLSKGLKREFEVVITNSEINKLVDEKLQKIAKEANLPGFRPGKVPVSVVKNRFGKQILGEVVRESVDNAMEFLDSKIEEGFMSADTREPIKKTMRRFTKMR